MKILLDDQDDLKILPGMSVRADIYTRTTEETLAVPIQAIRYDEEADEDGETTEDQAFVFLVRDGKAVRRDVKTGISSDSDQEIVAGLEEGDTIVSGPFRVLRHLNDGDPVEEKEEEKESDAEVTVSVSG